MTTNQTWNAGLEPPRAQPDLLTDVRSMAVGAVLKKGAAGRVLNNRDVADAVVDAIVKRFEHVIADVRRQRVTDGVQVAAALSCRLNGLAYQLDEVSDQLPAVRAEWNHSAASMPG